MTSAGGAAAAADDNNCGKKVCVMDASGRLGSALVRRLLLAGYTVHAALLHTHPIELEDGGLESCEKGKRLRVFHYSDPLDYHTVLDALAGCSALFYSFELPDDHPTYDELIGELEVRAAHNVLEACAHTHTIDKVIFTSSATAIIWRDCDDDDNNHRPHSGIDERAWSDVNFCKKFKLWHGVSKTMAEKTAWALAMDRGVNMVSINGGLLMCPDSSIKDPYLLGAAEMYKYGVFVTVDLEFLVDAHMCVFEDPSSYGRYLCFNGVINCNKDVQKLASQLSSSVVTSEEDGVYQQRISNRKLSKLMLDFRNGA